MTGVDTMAASAPTGDGGITDGVSLQLSRYDVHLVGIPIVLLLSLVFHVLLGVGLQFTLATASLVSAIFMLDAMFLNPPMRHRGTA